MKIYEAQPDDQLFSKLIDFSEDWERENSTHGYRKNNRGDIENNRIFLAEENKEIIGYLFGNVFRSERASSIIPDGTPYFEIEELYVVPNRRSEGIGSALFLFAEQRVKEAGIEYIFLSTATKNYTRILHFYIDELGMDFWNARLFKKLQEKPKSEG